MSNPTLNMTVGSLTFFFVSPFQHFFFYHFCTCRLILFCPFFPFFLILHEVLCYPFISACFSVSFYIPVCLPPPPFPSKTNKYPSKNTFSMKLFFLICLPFLLSNKKNDFDFENDIYRSMRLFITRLMYKMRGEEREKKGGGTSRVLVAQFSYGGGDLLVVISDYVVLRRGGQEGFCSLRVQFACGNGLLQCVFHRAIILVQVELCKDL